MEDEDSSEFPLLFKCSLSNVIHEVLSAREGWSETWSEASWDLNWADVGWIKANLETNVKLKNEQKVNHFKNHFEISRKDMLHKNLLRLKQRLLKEASAEEAIKMAFFPKTFVLPSDYQLFIEFFRQNPDRLWIMKPASQAQGRGIFLFRNLSDISDWKRDYSWNSRNDVPKKEVYVVQEYISNPLLIGGKKFDLRLYVLVMSFTPLTVWIHRNGFARFTCSTYTNDIDSISNTYIHLTNFSIQKKKVDSARVKWNVQSLRQFLTVFYGEERTSLLFAKIQDLLIKTVLSGQPVIIQNSHCFELFGFDVLVDDNLKPWLLEVNSSPSLTASDEEDHKVKYGVLEDCLDVVDIEGERLGNEVKIGGFDLVYNNSKELDIFPTLEEWIDGKKCVFRESMIGCSFDTQEILETTLDDGLAF